MAGNQAQFAIDIAATMSGGEYTIAELDRLSSTLAGGGKGAEHFQRAIQAVAGGLDAAKAVTVSANSALADANEEYAALEKAALAAARAYEKAAKKGPVRQDVADAVTRTSAALEAHAKALVPIEDAAAAAAKREADLATQLKNVQRLSGHVDRSLAGQAESLAKVQGALSAVGGPVGRLGQLILAPQKAFADLSQTMGSTQATAMFAAAGVGILVAAVVALTAAVVVGVVKLAAWAVGLADTARSANLSAQALGLLNPQIGALSGQISALSDETGVASSTLRGIAKSLQGANVSAKDLPAALRAAALAEAALGQGGAQEFIDAMGKSKKSVAAFAAEAQTKLGGIVARQMLGLEAQGARFQSNIAKLFGGLDIDPALGGLETLVGLFDKTSAAGRAIELLFGKVFQPLIDNAQNAAYVVEAFTLGFLIGLTKLYIAAKPVIQTVAELFGFENTSLADVLTATKKAGEVFALVFAGAAVVFTALTAAIGVVIGVLVAWNAAIVAAVVTATVFAAKMWSSVIGFFQALPGAISGAVASLASGLANAASTVLGGMRGLVANAIALVSNPSQWVTIGSQIVAGIAAGIAGAAGAVLRAIGGVVSGAISQAKRMLGIASPSKVFAKIGDFTGQGFVGGVEDQTDAAQGALVDLVSPMSALQTVDAGVAAAAPVAASAAEAAAPAVASPGPSKSVDLKGATFNFHGVADAKDADRLFGETLTRLLEGDAMALGAAVGA